MSLPRVGAQPHGFLALSVGPLLSKGLRGWGGGARRPWGLGAPAGGGLRLGLNSAAGSPPRFPQHGDMFSLSAPPGEWPGLLPPFWAQHPLPTKAAQRQSQEDPPHCHWLTVSSPWPLLSALPPPGLLSGGRERDRAAHELHGHPAWLLAGGHPYPPTPGGHRPPLAQLLSVPGALPAVPVPAVPGCPPSLVHR